MPHAIEMPSLLADENTITEPSMLPSTRPAYDTPSQLRQSHEKVNGIPRSSANTPVNGSGAVGDTAYDLYSDAGAKGHFTNGDMFGSHQHPDASLNSIPNGRTSGGSWEHKSSKNGSALSVNGMNGIAANGENGRKSPGPLQNGIGRTSNGDKAPAITTNGAARTSSENSSKPKTNGNSTEPTTYQRTDSTNSFNQLSSSPIDTPFNRVDVPAPISTNPQSTGPLTYGNSLIPNPTTDSPSRATTASPHRFSSPPAYPTPLAPSPSNTSLQPPGTLKHRHTLQVPKPVPGRNSKDGEEAVYSSGRFSPTSIAQGVRRGSLSLNRRNTQSIHSNMPHEEIALDENTMRWAEHVRQKRASKKKAKEDEDDDRVVVGTKVDQNHVNWVTAYNMLTGIRFTVSRTNAKMDRPLTDADFDARHKFSFDITGNELTPSAKYDFKFKDYAPWVFRHLRSKFKLDPADYLMSLTSKYILSELGSPGKSGSFFYFSRDYKYIIKTIHHAEHKFLRKILKEYYSHVEQNPNTLLSQFYGLHRVKIPYGRKIHFVVMNNLFPPHRDIHATYDLKGSTVGREFHKKEGQDTVRVTLKDMNWLHDKRTLPFGPEKRNLFIEQMERDVRLLQKLKIMDYSMLVGIHDLKTGNDQNLRDKTLQVFQPGGDTPSEEPEVGPGKLMRTPSTMENARKARELRQIIKQEKPVPMGQSSSRMPDHMEENITKRDFTFYSDDGGFRATHEDNSPDDEILYLSIIDCLTHYGLVKKLENLWKGLSNDRKLISPISPEPYGERFMQFIEGITKCKEEADREEASAARLSLPNANDNSSGLDSGRRRSGSLALRRPSTQNPAVQRAENEVIKEELKGNDIYAEPKTMGVIRSPSAERTGGLQGQTLPVVDEFGEASSNGGRSVKSSKSGERPRTPMKNNDHRPITPQKDEKWVNGANLSPNLNGNSRVRKTLSRSSLDKDLPPLPPNGEFNEKEKGRAIE